MFEWAELERVGIGEEMLVTDLAEWEQGFPKACLEILQDGYHAVDDQSGPVVPPLGDPLPLPP